MASTRYGWYCVTAIVRSNWNYGVQTEPYLACVYQSGADTPVVHCARNVRYTWFIGACLDVVVVVPGTAYM